MKTYLAPLALLAALIAGCATTPIPTNLAIPVPNDRILATDFFVKKADAGEVIVKRDSGFGGSACSSRVFVNATAVADIMPSEKIVLYLPEGEYLVGAKPNGVCGGGLSESRATVKVGKTTAFRIGYGSNGDFSIQPTAF